MLQFLEVIPVAYGASVDALAEDKITRENAEGKFKIGIGI